MFVLLVMSVLHVGIKGVAWGILYVWAGLDVGCLTLVGWTALRFMTMTCYASSLLYQNKEHVFINDPFAISSLR
jgi:hypothetical protein